MLHYPVHDLIRNVEGVGGLGLGDYLHEPAVTKLPTSRVSCFDETVCTKNQPAPVIESPSVLRFLPS